MSRLETDDNPVLVDLTSEADQEATRSLRRVALPLLAFLIGVLAIFSSGHTYSSDDETVLEATQSLLQGDGSLHVTPSNIGSLSLRELDDGSFVGVPGLGQSIIATPLTALGQIVASVAPTNESDQVARVVALLTNAVVLALAGLLVVRLSMQMGASLRGGLLLCFIYVFATMAWAHSKTLFTELSTALLLALAVSVSIDATSTTTSRQRARLTLAAGMAIGFAMHVRPSAGLFIPWIGIYLLVSTLRRWGWRPAALTGVVFGVGVSLMVSLLLITNYWRFGSATDLGYENVPYTYPVLRGFVNHFFSSGKSIFLYAPIVAVALAGSWRSARTKPGETGLILAIVVTNTLFYSQVPYWAGDSAWGPRYVQIVLPLLVVLAAPVVDMPGWRTAVKVAGVAGLLAAGLLGASVSFGVGVTYAYDNVPDATGWVESDQSPRYVEAMQHQLAWQPQLTHAQLLPEALRRSLGATRPSEAPDRAYPAGQTERQQWFWKPPYLDIWWILLPKEGVSRYWWVLVLPMAASATWGGVVLVRRLKPPPAVAGPNASERRVAGDPDGPRNRNREDLGRGADAAELGS